MFVARLSETALTAASLVYSIQFLMIAVGVGTAVGLILMMITALIFSIVGIFFSDTIARHMTRKPELQEMCQQYLSVNLVFCWGIFIQTYGQRLLQAVGDTVLSMFSLIIGAVVNIILDPIMIFGLLGCPQMGIGTAWFSFWIAEGIAVIYSYRAARRVLREKEF